MSRTIRKLHPRTRIWILKEKIAPENHPNWKRHNEAQLRGQDGTSPSEIRTNLNTDRHGNSKRDGWTLDWTGSRFIFRRYVNRQQRQANKIKCRLGYEDHLDDLEQTYLDQFDWYDDEDMDLPDWWHDPFDDPIDFENDEPFERDTNIDQFDCGDFYDPFDDYF